MTTKTCRRERKDRKTIKNCIQLPCFNYLTIEISARHVRGSKYPAIYIAKILLLFKFNLNMQNSKSSKKEHTKLHILYNFPLPSTTSLWQSKYPLDLKLSITKHARGQAQVICSLEPEGEQGSREVFKQSHLLPLCRWTECAWLPSTEEGTAFVSGASTSRAVLPLTPSHPFLSCPCHKS